MTLRKTREDREWDKFYADDDDLTTVRVGGKLSFSGLRIGGKFTEVEINDTTWTALPLSALPNRNAISIQNQSNVEIKVNYDPLLPGYIGTWIQPSGERSYDITPDVIIYAKSQSGLAIIGVEELA